MNINISTDGKFSSPFSYKYKYKYKYASNPLAMTLSCHSTNCPGNVYGEYSWEN